ncbi:MAG TPA: hypothetical protein RMH99_24765 [Sandaracinaceae bacterium LLY-WYZ-13_1]|nr:hypothetical protein [Sandaracinaceae bacterium LLY-WYZ-13_1]
MASERDDGERDLFDELNDDPPLDDEDGEPVADDPERRRRRLERILPQVIKRAIEKGLETGFDTISTSGEALRGVMGESGKVPREIVGYIFSQVDETKNAMVRVVAHEIRDFLSATDLSKELQKALTSLSFEIRTEIRFIPNEAGGLKPEVKADVDPKRARRRRSKPPPAPEDESDDEEES